MVSAVEEKPGRLGYQTGDGEIDQRHMDPLKAKQAERLGMARVR